MYGGLSFGQTADYCEGDDCPEKLTIEGFDVRISPNVYSAPDFTNTLLGQHLDTLKAQLLWMTSKTSVPPSAIEQLIDSGVSIYIDTDTNFSEWWPCGTGTAGCYNSGVNRVGMPFSTGDVRILETHTHLSFTLHELWRTDPETYSLIWNAWHDPDGFCEERRWRLHQNWTDDPVSSVESR